MSGLHAGRERRVVLYGRVSKLDDGATEGRSVDSQLDVGRAWAAREGAQIVAVHRDDGVSAWNPRAKRAGWQEVMAALALGTANELWVWEVSRASREREVWVKLIRTCQANDCLLTVDNRTHDPNDPDDGFMLDLMAALAVRESGVTRKRIMRTVGESAAAGWPHGKIPWAYRREYDPATGQLLRQVPDERYAPVLQEMAARVLAGESLYRVCHDLNDRDIPSPETVRQQRVHGAAAGRADWTAMEVKRQLVSPTNAGLRARKGTIVAEATWPGIITAEQHAALVAKLCEPGRKTWRDGGTKHLLTGIAECGVCGARLRRTKNRGYPSYSCPGVLKRGASCVSRVQRQLDAWVILQVAERLQDKELAQRLIAAQKAVDADAGSAMRELVDLRARLKEFENAAMEARNPVAVESFMRVVDGLARQIDDAEARAHVVGPVPMLLLSLAGPDAPQRFDDLQIEQQRQVVRALFRVVVKRSSRPHGARGFDRSSIELTPVI